MRISDWSSDVCSSDLVRVERYYLGTQSQRSKLGPEIVRLVLTDNCNRLAAPNAHGIKAESEPAHLFQHIAKAVFAPDAPLFVPLRNAVGLLLTAQPQQLGHGLHLTIQPVPRTEEIRVGKEG